MRVHDTGLEANSTTLTLHTGPSPTLPGQWCCAWYHCQSELSTLSPARRQVKAFRAGLQPPPDSIGPWKLLAETGSPKGQDLSAPTGGPSGIQTLTFSRANLRNGANC